MSDFMLTLLFITHPWILGFEIFIVEFRKNWGEKKIKSQMQEGWISIGNFGIPSKAEAYEKFSKRLVQGKKSEMENVA